MTGFESLNVTKTLFFWQFFVFVFADAGDLPRELDDSEEEFERGRSKSADEKENEKLPSQLRNIPEVS